jgi:twinfilin-like protein
MSHSSGIGVASNVRESFVNGSHRFIKVQIAPDYSIIDLVSTFPQNGSFESDLTQLNGVFETNRPCFILARLDKTNARGQARWALFTYIPDKAPVKEKMTYSSSKSNLKSQVGDDFFTDDLFGTVPSDFTLDGYKSYVRHKEADAPLTREEEKVIEDREMGVFVGGGGTGGAYQHGIAFPVDDDANSAFDHLKNGSKNYIQLTIDINAERVRLCESSNISLGDIESKILNNEPRFHFFNYSHEHEGANITSLIYIYSCPDGSKGTQSAPVKMRMLFSSSKANVSTLATSRGLDISLKMEVNNYEDVTEGEIIALLHPPKPEEKKKINKPTPIGGRKLIRNTKQ